MLRYIAIQAPIQMKASISSLVQSYWRRLELWADFCIPHDEKSFLRVHFRRAEVVRVLDEMPLSTEEPAHAEGIVKEHFAYIVEGAPFWLSLPEALRETTPGLKHYRFVTGWACLDVLSNYEPGFQIVDVDTPFIEMLR